MHRPFHTRFLAACLSIGLALASIIVPVATSVAQAQSNKLYNPPPVVARGDWAGSASKSIDPMYVSWSLSGDKLTLCWPKVYCVVFADARLYNKEYTDACSGQGGTFKNMAAGLGTSLRQETIFAEFKDCYSGTHDNHWQGKLIVTNNRTGQIYECYCTELRDRRSAAID